MTTIEFIFALVLGIIASSGFWGVVLYKMQKNDNKKDNSTKLLFVHRFDTSSVEVLVRTNIKT